MTTRAQSDRLAITSRPLLLIPMRQPIVDMDTRSTLFTLSAPTNHGLVSNIDRLEHPISQTRTHLMTVSHTNHNMFRANDQTPTSLTDGMRCMIETSGLNALSDPKDDSPYPST